jgi:SpoU rRNA methylase family enzyme
MNDKATALKEISEHLQVLAGMITLKAELANKANRHFDPRDDVTVMVLVNTINVCAANANITVAVDLSEYYDVRSTDIDSDWMRSDCVEEEWQPSETDC